MLLTSSCTKWHCASGSINQENCWLLISFHQVLLTQDRRVTVKKRMSWCSITYFVTLEFISSNCLLNCVCSIDTLTFFKTVSLYTFARELIALGIGVKILRYWCSNPPEGKLFAEINFLLKLIYPLLRDNTQLTTLSTLYNYGKTQLTEEINAIPNKKYHGSWLNKKLILSFSWRILLRN